MNRVSLCPDEKTAIAREAQKHAEGHARAAADRIDPMVAPRVDDGEAPLGRRNDHAWYLIEQLFRDTVVAADRTPGIISNLLSAVVDRAIAAGALCYVKVEPILIDHFVLDVPIAFQRFGHEVGVGVRRVVDVAKQSREEHLATIPLDGSPYLAVMKGGQASDYALNGALPHRPVFCPHSTRQCRQCEVFIWATFEVVQRRARVRNVNGEAVSRGDLRRQRGDPGVLCFDFPALVDGQELEILNCHHAAFKQVAKGVAPERTGLPWIPELIAGIAPARLHVRAALFKTGHIFYGLCRPSRQGVSPGVFYRQVLFCPLFNRLRGGLRW